MKMKKLMVIILVFTALAGCTEILESKQVSPAPTTTTVKPMPAPMPGPATTTTVRPAPRPAPNPATTINPTTTTVLREQPPAPAPEDECLVLQGQLNKSVCYFNKAIEKNDKSICEKITHSITKDMCLERVGVEDDKSSRIFGQVVSKRYGSQSGIPVSVNSKTRDVKYSDDTNSAGRYSVNVNGGDSYSITINYKGEEYTQHANAKRNFEHQYDFVINE